MPTLRSRNFVKILYAYKDGGKKPKDIKYKGAESEFNNVNQADFNSDWGSGTSRREAYTDPVTGKQQTRLVSNATLAPNLQPSNELAAEGLRSSLSYLSMDPNQRVENVTSGNDPMFQALELQRQKAEDQVSGRAAVRAQGTGNLNSTAYGSTLGAIDNESQTRKLQNILASLQYGNDTATSGASTAMGVQSGLAGLIYPQQSAANNNLMTAFNANNQINQSNAANQMQVDMTNAQRMDAYNQAKQKSMAGMIGGGVGTLASIGLAPFTGGASLMALPGTLGSMFGGGGGGSAPVPSNFQFSNPFLPTPGYDPGMSGAMTPSAFPGGLGSNLGDFGGGGGLSGFDMAVA